MTKGARQPLPAAWCFFTSDWSQFPRLSLIVQPVQPVEHTKQAQASPWNWTRVHSTHLVSDGCGPTLSAVVRAQSDSDSIVAGARPNHVIRIQAGLGSVAER